MSGFDRRSHGDGDPVKPTGDALGAPGKRTLIEAIQDPVSAAVQAKGAGAPVSAEVKQAVEPVVGRDLGDVRVHTDAAAAASSQAIGARAFAYGSEVFLGAGERATDKRLMAHELTHVAQQHGTARAKLVIGESAAPEELEADAVASAVARGSSDRIAISTGAPAIRRAPANDHKEAAAAAALPLPGWTEKELKLIQAELIRLGLYRATADGNLGEGTQSALVEAFGSDEWRTMDAAGCVTKLKAAKPPPGKTGDKAGQHELRFGEMFKDGVLDMTVALGFDEQGFNRAALTNLTSALTGAGFVSDAASAANIYKQAGRTPGGLGDWYVKKDALTYAPPAGTPRAVHAVVRLVYSLDGSKGKEVGEAFTDSMVQSDIAYYSGHGRYGSGPDFDRNFSIDLLRADGSVEIAGLNYKDAERELAKDGKPAGRDAWEQFLWRVDKKTIRVNSSNDGNVVLNTDNAAHTGEFGGKLMYWNLTKNGHNPPKLTGDKAPLGAAADKATDRKYRVVVFDGCNSVDYEKQLRKTSGFDAAKADMFGSSSELNWGDEGKTLAAFLDSLIKMQSAEQIAKNLDKQQTGQSGVYHAYGITDNPILK